MLKVNSSVSCSANASGLYDCFNSAMSNLHIQDEYRDKVIGFECDGTNVNMADGGVKGLLENDMPKIVGFWCLCHRQELSLRDALNGTFFQQLMRY